MPSTGGASGGPTAAVAFATEVLTTGQVTLSARSTRPIYMLTCKQPTTLQKQDVTGFWVPLRDERPGPNESGGFYLDGEYQANASRPACDVVRCEPWPSSQSIGSVLEYVQAGVSTASDGTIAPYIQSIAVRGELRILVNYYEDSACGQLVSTSVSLFAPDGVCCPTGADGCYSTGPLGGWAIAPDQCPGRVGPESRYLYLGADGWGCPKLVPGGNRCCGCDDDAGVAP